MKSRHFKWVTHFLDDLRAKRLEGPRQLLGVWQAQERRHFRDIIIRDETWVYLGMKPGTIWLPADTELPVLAKKTIVSEKRILIVFWGIQGITHDCWLSTDGALDSLFFCEEVLRPLAQKMQPNSKKSANP
jgi:hypothetical protein